MSEETVTPEALHEEAVTKAKALNWVPKEEYKGNPAHWRDAEEFLDFGERLNPILRENNRRLETALQESKQQIAQIQEEVKKFAVLHEQTEKVAYAKAVSDLKVKKAEALEQGNYNEVVELDEQLANTKEAAKKIVPPVVITPPVIAESIKREYDEWTQKNQWAVENSPKFDPEMDAYARAIGEVLVKKEGYQTTGENFKPFLAKVEEKVRARFPEKFENPNRQRASSTDGGGESGGDSNGGSHTYSHLPKEAKEACDMLVKTKVLTKQEYLDKYQWDRR